MSSGSTVNVLFSNQGKTLQFAKLINTQLYPFTLCFHALSRNSLASINDDTSLPFMYMAVNLFLLFVNKGSVTHKIPRAAHLSYTIPEKDMDELKNIAAGAVTVSKKNNVEVYEILKRYYNYYAAHINQGDEINPKEGVVKDIFFDKMTAKENVAEVNFKEKLETGRQLRPGTKKGLELTFNFKVDDLVAIDEKNIKTLVQDKKLEFITIEGDLMTLLSNEGPNEVGKKYTSSGIKCLNFAEDLFKEEQITQPIQTPPQKGMDLWKKLFILFVVIFGTLLLLTILCCLLKKRNKKDTVLSLAPIGF